ncbi:MAG TPA: FAD-linked oxidase C-terminal domain-containing protein [Bacteroidales bacterium]|nr:FAD-linked oxidase C-terminal domain-containing protein [Bacteroidales bacterium]HOK75718.1 FAD-linked oxidase C-terminal domain-containing protein [Bacteroidales bacterium]HOM39672.1 FAD-linked oxidase C-terminal domain-containing protein [Bacteroidales bacterium]HPP92046.1 FAD-linked oxidase C-terminal domain-containing protein [Bacteroidales bacterium]HQG56651.1 FAD-linked oxidase C-terminal domain-containing protein [Bacteroidales bacterium]
MKSLFKKFDQLKRDIEGELRYDTITRTIYSTDASVYREVPLCVTWPHGIDDIKKIIKFAGNEKIAVIPRAAGTSLAGQVVGKGIIVDISRHMNRILEVNPEERYVRVEPGVVLDELNIFLRKYGLFFGPETSTANRCNIGGMAGNNACGLHSLIYGSTRDHIIELKAVLSDGSEVVFGPVNQETFNEKCKYNNLEGKIYRNIFDILSNPLNKKIIIEEYPDRSITRRNTGYALDLLLENSVFDRNSANLFNFSKLIAGSEGTLAIITELKLNLLPLPSPHKALVCIHLHKRNEAFLANLVALRHHPSAVEMMDDRILELTKGNITQRKNRFFIKGEPGAILIVEFIRDTPEQLTEAIEVMIEDMKNSGFGYHFPVIQGKDISKVWDLRKAGLGVLSNLKGDAKPVSLIEDSALNVETLPAYMEEFEKMLKKYGKECVYHAHIGTGELHTRPILNLKDPGDVKLFRTIGLETAKLVKKYRGSMSGEHGDGRLRGEFVPIIIGEHNYNLLKQIKSCWDPQNILNPGKIIDTPPMDTFLRYKPGQKTPDLKTYFDFSSTDGVIRAAESCNGSADCRKSAIIGGVMCPSYMATKEEKNTTRARANVLREFLSKENGNSWNSREIYEILDLCLSCKGCKSECPSNVDIAKLKAEFLQHWYHRHGAPLRSIAVAYMPYLTRLGALAPSLFNYFVTNKVFSSLIKRILRFSVKRSIPGVYRVTLRKWLKKNLEKINPVNPIGTVCLFIDEFTDLNDTEIGIKAVKLLTSLNYKIVVADHTVSARTFLSKGFLKKARRRINRNILVLSDIVNERVPLVGIEPSAILGFRDEYPELASIKYKEDAKRIALNTYLFDEFIALEHKKGNISKERFCREGKTVLVHTHCQQKSIASSASLIESLSIPGYTIKEIPSGCCGMAGSFGYEKEHYELSNKIGELILFPEVRNAPENTIICAPGTSCRHHIKEGTGRKALHPAEILYDALMK